MNTTKIGQVFKILRQEPPPRLTMVDAPTLSGMHVPPFPPDIPALLMGIESRELATQIRRILLWMFPPEHIVHAVDDETSWAVRLEDFESFSEEFSLFVPALEQGSSFETFSEIVAHLRAPDGCPWDREQTHHSLRTHLLEETYEVLSAMDDEDSRAMREEFGDLLLQMILNVQIAYEAGEFTMAQVIKSIHDKIVRRHPHVFGEVKLESVKGVLQNWEKLKESERRNNKTNKGLLDGVPAALPALTQAQEYQDRAARVGFDWPEIEGVLEKVREEIEEIKQADNLDEVTTELGDLLFVLVNLARWRRVDAESALRAANLKFKNRFSYLERCAQEQNRNLSDLTLEEMDELWKEAKNHGI